MQPKNLVYIATSIDGYIAGENNDLSWLNELPTMEGNDMGYAAFMERVDALLMGRVTFEIVAGFDIEWPYQKPVFVISSTISEVPEKLTDNVFILNQDPTTALASIRNKGFKNVYIDGGKTIQSLLSQDAIDEMIITIIPTILGKGSRLFGTQEQILPFDLVSSKAFENGATQLHFKRKKESNR